MHFSLSQCVKRVRVFRTALITAGMLAALVAVSSLKAQDKVPDPIPAPTPRPTPFPPPVLTKANLSPELTPTAIVTAMRKVADWQLARSEASFKPDWTNGVLFTGFMAASTTTGDPKYYHAMLAMGEKFNWQLGKNPPHADDQCVAQTYLELYLQHPDPKMIETARKQFDEMLSKPKGGWPWSWCDALFMAPPSLARLYKITGDTKYLDFMSREWWITSKKLYDEEAHLYFRDKTFFPTNIVKKTGKPALEANGKKIFWSRGNGWVMGGLVRVLQFMPADYPDRPNFVKQFKEMAAALLAIQGSDGLWRSGLLDPDTYQQPENSGSALFTYAFAWGINEGILDRATYLPAVQKAWAGLVSHIYADGRLGSIQPVGMGPSLFKPTSSENFGVGAFLLVGSELHRLARPQTKPVNK